MAQDRTIPAVLPVKASIETCTTCNHACTYCPVSEFPMPHQVMDLKLYRHVMDELAGLGNEFKRISFNHYNEPLVDPHLVARIRLSLEYSFFGKILLNSNLSVARKNLPAELEFARDRIEFNINLPTADPERYRKLHGKNHYARVEKNIQRFSEAGFAMKINIQCNLLVSEADRQSVIDRFGDVVHIEAIESTSRGGLVQALKRKHGGADALVMTGCVQERPVSYVHVGVSGEVFFCCQDYYKKYRMGDLTRQPLKEILDSPTTRRYLEYVYLGRKAPADFICNRCELAIYEADGTVQCGSAVAAH